MSPTFTTLDLAIIVLIGLSILIGVLRGATREVLGIVGWIGAFATVFYGLPLFRPMAQHYIHNHMIADALVAVILFILSLAVFILISRLISSRVKGSLLGGMDRSLGLVFGFIRGLFLVCLVYLAIGFFYPPDKIPDAIKHARFTPWLAQGAQELKHLIPKTYLPQEPPHATITPLDAKDLLEHHLPTLEETVKNLSTLKPASPKKQDLDKLIEKNDTETQE